MTYAHIAASLALVLAEHGVAATYLPHGGTSPTDDVALQAHLDEAPSQADGRNTAGRTLVRQARATLLAEDLAALPEPGARLTVSAGPHAGAWIVTSIETHDDAAIVVRLRRAETIAGSAPNATARRA